MTALLWCDKMYKNISKKLLHLTIEFFLRTKREKSACIVQESMLYCTVHETFHVMAAWIEIEGVLINELV